MKTLLERIRYWLGYEAGRDHGSIRFRYFDHPDHGKELSVQVGVNEITFHQKYYYYERFKFSWAQWNFKTYPIPRSLGYDWYGSIQFGAYSLSLGLYFWRNGQGY